MRSHPSKSELFKARHFEQEIIVLCVRWYLRYKLSYRDLVEMMAERGLPIAHTTILRWFSGTRQSSTSAGAASRQLSWPSKPTGTRTGRRAPHPQFAPEPDRFSLLSP
jgi:hypothetical protein